MPAVQRHPKRRQSNSHQTGNVFEIKYLLLACRAGRLARQKATACGAGRDMGLAGGVGQQRGDADAAGEEVVHEGGFELADLVQGALLRQ